MRQSPGLPRDDSGSCIFPYFSGDWSDPSCDYTTLIPTTTRNIGEFMTDEAVLAQLQEVLVSRKYQVPAVLGQTSRVSMKGALIEVSHHLTMKVCTPFGANNPVVSTPVIVQPRSNVTLLPPPPTAPPLAVTPSQLLAEAVAVPIATDLSPQENNNSEYYLPATSAPPKRALEGVPALLAALRCPNHRLGEVQTWLQHNTADLLEPQDLKALYQAINRVSDQMELTDLLLQSCSSLTWQHIAMVVKSCSSTVNNADIIRKMSAKCSDKQNYQVIEKQLLPFEWHLVKNSFLP